MENNNNKLGRGLSALLGGSSEEELLNQPQDTSNKVDIELIVPNQDQPRKYFDDEKIRELSGSISIHGILQPIAVRKKGNTYEIIAGERRWRAAKMAGLKQVPVHILDVENNDVTALALIENIQRSDLNPIEEAEAIKILINECNCTQESVGVMLCKSRSYIGNTLKLLSLPARVRELIKNGKLSAGHGKCLLGIQNADEIAGLAVGEGWNVRQLEGAIRDLKAGVTQRVTVEDVAGRYPEKKDTPFEDREDPETVDIANRVANALNVNTKLKITKNGGVFTLTCKSCEELELLVDKFLSLK